MKKIGGLIAIIISFLIVYFVDPFSFNISNEGLWILCIFCLGVGGVTELILNSELSKALKYFWGAGILFGLFFIIEILSSPLINSKSYYNLIGDVKKVKLSDEQSITDMNKIIIVDEEMSFNLARKKIGEISALGSVSELNISTLQQINGDLYWILPLEHKNIFTAYKNEGSAGYIKVSATKLNDVELVQQLNGENIKLTQQFTSKLFDNIYRKTKLKYKNKIIQNNEVFEIDDNGNPYWIFHTVEKSINLFGGEKLEGLIVVNAITGKSDYYDIDNVPNWIENVYTGELIYKYISYWGKYVNGFINFSHTDQLETTPNISLVNGVDGGTYWLTGMTSVGKDDATVGFIMVNSKTFEAKMYNCSGATEEAAMLSAEGEVQEKEYDAGYPIVYNILDTPTYVIPLKDSAGLIKNIAMMPINDYSTVTVASNLKDTYNKYKIELKKNKTATIGNNGDLKNIVGSVEKAVPIVKDGNTYLYLKLTGYNDKIELSPELYQTIPFIEEGLNVTVKYYDYYDNNIVIDSIIINN